jgi:capsular polysaccharide transport system permease protein
MSDAENRRRILFIESLGPKAGADSGRQTSEDARSGADQSAPDSRFENDEATKSRRRGLSLRGDTNLRPRVERLPDEARRGISRQRKLAPPVGTPPTLSLPTRTRRRSYLTTISFAVCVLLPIAVASIYYGFIAADQYMAEFRFSVIDTSSSSSSSTSTALAGLSSFLGGSGSSGSQNYLVTDFLTSRQAVDELEKKINLAKLYSRPIADWWSRYNNAQPIEKLLPYWQSMVNATYDPVTGLATAQIRAFTAEDAQLIASTLVSLAEGLVNEIATRPQKDAIRYAENEVKRAEARLKEVQLQLTDYRNTESVIDPTNSVVMSNVSLAQSLRGTLTQLDTQLSTLLQQKINQSAPTVQVLQSRIAATKSQLADVDAQISKNTNGNQALSKVVSQYESLMLDRGFAQNMVTSTMTTLELTRANAAAQHLYITPYVRPSLPESAIYPKRIQMVLWVALISWMIWTLGLLFYRAIRES